MLRLFEDQLARGGPITVTDERVTRYFMVVEESVGLVLQAAAMAAYSGQAEGRLGVKPRGCSEQAEALRSAATLSCS